ncbi:MAG: aminopeptidase P family protein [Sphingobacteriales bacterium]|nr:aminopeptidase P family protein [Sphingobacteriales bacterium]
MDSRRTKMVGELIRRNSLAALLFWRPDELVMMLGYFPLWGVSVLLYPADGEPVLFVPALEPEDILPKGITVKKYPWGALDGNDPWEVLYSVAKEELFRRGLADGVVSFTRSIGGSAPCRMSAEQPPLPADLVLRLERVCAGGWKDTGAELSQLYDEKTPTDIVALEKTHKIAALAVEVFYREVGRGHTEAMLGALIESAVQETNGRGDVGFAKAWPMLQSGLNAADAGRFNRSTGKLIVPGDLVVLEMGVCVDGYWADITRTAVVGQATHSQQHMYEAVAGAQEAAFRLLRPGAAMREVDNAARSFIADAGFGSCFPHALGHQTGFRYHDPGDVLSPYSTGILREGMVVTVEPGVYSKELGSGLRIEDNVLITPGGYRILSAYPRDLKGGNQVYGK